MKAFLQVLHKVIEETGRKRLCGFLKRRDESVWKVVERCAKVWVAKIKAGRIYFFFKLYVSAGVFAGNWSDRRRNVFFFVFHFSPVINYTIGPFVERATWNNIDALLKHTP